MSCKRNYLEYGQKLKLVREGNGNEYGEWIIGEPVGEGASSVCYTATSGNKSGRLKQLNPLGKNVNDDSINDFLSAYRILDSVKSKNPRYGVLNNYIPYYEILFEKDENGKIIGTFIWTPDDKSGRNFEDYLKEVRKNPHSNPERKLYEIVSVIATLTDVICLMHMAGLLHLDIKSSNFLVTFNSRLELNTGNISLFDLNTLYSVESSATLFSGTEGFTAPEVEYGRADNRSDIYSIGAILFNAIVISNELPDNFYHGNYYDELDSLIGNSELIAGSSLNSKPEVVGILTDILRKCLNKSPANRYDYCELLIEDLEEAKRILAGNLFKAKNSDNTENDLFWNKKAIKWVVAGLLLLTLGCAVWTGIVKNKTNSVKEPVSEVSEASAHEEITETISEPEPDMLTEPEVVENTPGEAGAILSDKLESAGTTQNNNEKTVVADYELLGSKAFFFEGELIVPAGVTLIIPEDITYLNESMDDCIGVHGTLVCSPYKLFENAINYGNSFVHIYKDSYLYMDGMEVYGGKGNFWASAFLTRRNDWNPKVFYLEVFNDTYVSSTAQEFENAGYDYCFGYGDGEINLYFGDSDEPYDTLVPGPTEKLQMEIEQMVGTGGGEIIVDYPVTVRQGGELWVHTSVTVILKEGGTITVEDGATLYVGGTIIEDGGKIENPVRVTLVDDGAIN